MVRMHLQELDQSLVFNPCSRGFRQSAISTTIQYAHLFHLNSALRDICRKYMRMLPLLPTRACRQCDDTRSDNADEMCNQRGAVGLDPVSP